MHDPELKACPFCGSRNVSFVDDWEMDGIPNMTVICNNCSAQTRLISTPVDEDGTPYSEGDDCYDEALEEIFDLWNRRSSAAVRTDETIELAEDILSHAQQLCNRNASDEFFQKYRKLSDSLTVLKNQIRRERADLTDAESQSVHQAEPDRDRIRETRLTGTGRICETRCSIEPDTIVTLGAAPMSTRTRLEQPSDTPYEASLDRVPPEYYDPSPTPAPEESSCEPGDEPVSEAPATSSEAIVAPIICRELEHDQLESVPESQPAPDCDPCVGF